MPGSRQPLYLRGQRGQRAPRPPAPCRGRTGPPPPPRLLQWAAGRRAGCSPSGLRRCPGERAATLQRAAPVSRRRAPGRPRGGGGAADGEGEAPAMRVIAAEKFGENWLLESQREPHVRGR